MNRHEAYNAERKEIESFLGYAVPVSMVPAMIRTAAKIVQLIDSTGDYVTYKEARMILRLADKSLREISGGIE
jgi:hypothetical protein